MDKSIDKILEESVKKIIEFISPEEIILYGSYAKGTANENSDIDIAVILNDFSGDFLNESANLFGIVTKIDYRIEPVLLIKKHDKPGFIEHIKSYGRNLYTRN
ncbi:MAG: nucleotidyltransferase domain-containing protein [Ignavibacteriae bacterium]|nr:nucleotidyltransferase domain-containing protein [Ignavibacteriota bacterium]